MQDARANEEVTLEAFAAEGPGHLTRVYGTRPVDPVERLTWLRDLQRWFRTETGSGSPRWSTRSA